MSTKPIHTSAGIEVFHFITAVSQLRMAAAAMNIYPEAYILMAAVKRVISLTAQLIMSECSHTLVKGICCCVYRCTAHTYYNRLFSRRWPGNVTPLNRARKVSLDPIMKVFLNPYFLYLPQRPKQCGEWASKLWLKAIRNNSEVTLVFLLFWKHIWRTCYRVHAIITSIPVLNAVNFLPEKGLNETG